MRSVRFGARGPALARKVVEICNLAGYSPRVTGLLQRKPSLDLLGQALTHPTADPESNYELLEFLGDASYNTAVVYYVARRFSHIAHSSIATAVKVFARLKISLTSKTTLAQIGDRMGLLPFVSADDGVIAGSAQKLLEDVTEAFLGAITLLVDREICIGAGCGAVYRLVHALFESMEIDLRYEALFDARTRLKEVLDAHKETGTVAFVYSSGGSGGGSPRSVEARVLLSAPGAGRPVCIGEGRGATRSEAMQDASEQALHTLRHTYNVWKPVPSEYTNLI